MAITAYVGLPGHGKSYGVVEHVILPALRQGRTVVTNLALHFEALRSEFPGCDVRLFDVDAVKQDPSSVFQVVPPGAVWVVDEAWKLWPAGQTPKDVPEPLKAILAEHRHRVDEAGNSMQVVVVTQDLMQIGKFLRSLVDETFRVVKLRSLGMDKRYRVDVYTGPAEGPNPPEKRRVRQILGKYKPEVWRWYQSHTQREADGAGANETKVDGRGVVWKSPAVIAMFLAVPLLLVFGIWYVVGFFRKDHVQPMEVVQAAGQPVVRGQRREGPGVFGAPALRVVGTVIDSRPGRSVAFLSDGRFTVAVPFHRYCRQFVEGFVRCEYRGLVASNEFHESRDVGPVSAAGPVVALLGSASGD